MAHFEGTYTAQQAILDTLKDKGECSHGYLLMQVALKCDYAYNESALCAALHALIDVVGRDHREGETYYKMNKGV